MNLFKKLFGSKKEPVFEPDNTKLWQLMEAYGKDSSNENYKKVFEELLSDNAYLIVPTINDNPAFSEEWSTAQAGTTLQFTTVYDLDGLMVFGIFSSPEKLARWAKKEMTYTAMPAKTALEIAQQQNYGRVVIDSDQDTMFVLERDNSNVKKEVIKEDTEVQAGTPTDPISGPNKESLIKAFQKNSNIDEVYHFAMSRDGETVLILAIVLEHESENARQGVVGTINKGMADYQLQMPLDIMYLDRNDSWYDLAKEQECFYMK